MTHAHHDGCCAPALSPKQKLFCAFLTLGYPSLKATEELIKQFEKSGVDIIELGFPFSDPLADGPTIQYSSEQAIKSGVKIHHAFEMVARLRKQGCQVPILFFTYLNPIYHFGLKNFARKAAQSGFDGVIVPDLPPEEEPEFSKECSRLDIAQVFLVAPTTAPDRALMIARASRGFIYYVSLRGVTGARKSVAVDLKKNLAQLKRFTNKPVLIGFGVSSPEQAKKLSGMSQGVIVGSAIVDILRKSGGKTGPAVKFVQSMVQAVKG